MPRLLRYCAVLTMIAAVGLHTPAAAEAQRTLPTNQTYAELVPETRTGRAAPTRHPNALGLEPGTAPGAHTRALATVKVAAVNAAVSGAIAGVIQRLHGGSARDGFLRGVVGGLVVFGGKRLVVSDLPGARLAGRQVTAVGASMVQNAGAGIGTFDELVFPVGPVHVHRSVGRKGSIWLRIDLPTTVILAQSFLDSSLHFDASASLASGVPVYRTRSYRPAHDRWLGTTRAGLVIVREPDPIMITDSALEQAVFAHEFVHVVQHDQFGISVAHPIQDRLLSGTRFGRWVNRHADLGLHYLIAGAVLLLNENVRSDLFEYEAHTLARTGGLFETGGGGPPMSPHH